MTPVWDRTLAFHGSSPSPSDDDERAAGGQVTRVRQRRFAWITSWVVAACLSATVSVRAQTTSPSAAPTKPKTDAAQPKKDSPAPEAGAPEGSPVTGAKPTASQCEEYVAVLAGKKKDDALLADPKLQALAARSFDLVACGAVATDSDAPCALIREQNAECRLLWSVLHELRTNPKGRSFVFPDAKYEMCRTQPNFAPLCDRLRDAARSGDAEKCAGMGDQEAYCRAMITLDKSHCEKAKDHAGCMKVIEANELFAKGLKGLAEDGPPRERAFAKAALGDADACKSFAQAATASCASQAAPTGAAAATTAVPAPSRDVPASK